MTSWLPLRAGSENGILYGGTWFKIIWDDKVIWMDKQDANTVCNLLGAALQDDDFSRANRAFNDDKELM